MRLMRFLIFHGLEKPLLIDEDFVNVKDHLKDLKTKFDLDIQDLTENLDTKDYEKSLE